MARIMVIAGGVWQCPIIKLAKSMGHYVICTNLYEDSPAFAYADVGLVADVLDKEKNLEYARQYHPDVIMTDQSDIAVPTVAYVAEKMSLKGITIKIAEKFTNKHIMREITALAGFASPKYDLCYNADSVKLFFDQNGKCIIKPLNSQSSRGCHIIETYKDIATYFEDCVQYSNGEKAIVVEEYIEGIEYTVDGLKTEEEYITTAISEKEPFAYNKNVAKRLVFSKENEKCDYNKLAEINEGIVQALGLPFGITHAEYKYNNGQFYLIEIAARGGGTRISSDIVPLISGINSNKYLIEILLGQKVNIVRNKFVNCAVLGFFDIESGIVESITGVEQALKLYGVIDICLDIKKGDIVQRAQDDRSRCGYYILFANSMEELNSLESQVKSTIQIAIK